MKKGKYSKIIGKDESENMEWKPSLSQINEIVETVSALSNTKGGRIVIGVSKSGKILGVKIGKDTIERLTNKIVGNTDPKVYPRINVEKVEDKKIILIEVKESTDKLVLAFGRPFKRVGKSTLKMTKDKYERAILEKHREKLQFDRQICKEATLDDIDRNRVKWYLNKRKEIRRIKKPTSLSYSHLLMNLGAVKKSNGKIKPTNGGILFFGKNPQRFFIQSQLRAVKFKGVGVTHPTIDSVDCSGTLWEMVEQAEDFIRKNIHLFGRRTEKSFMREEKFEYPIKALREAIINALIHRNYYEPADTRIFIFDDRIEIINPGCFPEGVTPERPIHRPVNAVLCGLMYDIGFIEKYGSGIYMMRELCKKYGNKEPYYKLHPLETKLIFESPEKEVSFIEAEEYKGLNDRQKNILRFLYKHDKFTRKDYVSINKISLRQANDDINVLLKKGKIKKHGKGRGIFYTLLKVHD